MERIYAHWRNPIPMLAQLSSGMCEEAPVWWRRSHRPLRLPARAVYVSYMWMFKARKRELEPWRPYEPFIQADVDRMLRRAFHHFIKKGQHDLMDWEFSIWMGCCGPGHQAISVESDGLYASWETTVPHKKSERILPKNEILRRVREMARGGGHAPQQQELF